MTSILPDWHAVAPDDGYRAQVIPNLLDPRVIPWIGRIGVKSQDFHLAAVLGVVISRQLNAIGHQWEAADPAENRRGPVPAGSGADADTASQALRQAVNRQRDPQSFGFASQLFR